MRHDGDARRLRRRPHLRHRVPAADPVEAMRDGTAHRVPLIVGTNADEGRLFTRFLKLLPTTEPMIEVLLAGLRRRAARPDHRGLSGLSRARAPASGSAATSPSAPRRGRSPRRTAGTRRPTSTATTTRRARSSWSGLGATHATELFAVFDVYRTRFGSLLTAAADRRSARRVSDDVQTRWRAFSRTGVPGDGWPRVHRTPSARSWCSTASPASNTTRTPTARQAWEGFTLARAEAGRRDRRNACADSADVIA